MRPTLTTRETAVVDRRLAARFESVKRFATPALARRTPNDLREPYTRDEFHALSVQEREDHLRTRLAEQVLDQFASETTPAPSDDRAPARATAPQRRPSPLLGGPHELTPLRPSVHEHSRTSAGGTMETAPTHEVEPGELQRPDNPHELTPAIRYYVPCAGGCGRMLQTSGPLPVRLFCDSGKRNRKRRSSCLGLDHPRPRSIRRRSEGGEGLPLPPYRQPDTA